MESDWLHYDGLVVNRRIRKDDDTLFPGHELQAPVKSKKKGSVISGTVFECLTERLLGGDRRTTDSTADICPDTINDEKKIWAESKGAQRQHAFKVPIDQLDGYENIRQRYARQADPHQVIYALWTYTAKGITLPHKLAEDDPRRNGSRKRTEKKTVGEVIQLILDSTTYVDVLDLNVLRCIRQLCDEQTAAYNCSIRSYASWSNYHGGTYHALNVGHGFLESLRSEPKNMLVALGMNPAEYRWSTSKRAADHIVINGVELAAPPIQVFELVRPEGWTEYPGIEIEDVPF